MNYNSLMNKPTINYRELIGDNTVTEVGGITEEQFNTLLNTDLSSYYTKTQIDDLFSRSFVYREKSGSIVTFDCPASVNGIDKIVSEIVAVQDLHGYDYPWPAGGGKNKFDSDTVLSEFTKNNNKYVGMPSYVADNYVISGGFKTNTRYTLSYKAYNNTSTSSNFRFMFSYTDETEEIIGGFVDTTTEKVIVGTSAENKTISKIKRSYGNGVELTLYDIQLEEGSTATTFAPYSNICPFSGWDEVNVAVSPTTDAEDGTTYTTTLKDGQGNPMECYGGELSNENGVQTLTVTHGYIASYNGETLPSTWISDRDVYAEGTTPTTGAEVVYELATPQTIPQDNLAIASNAGINNIWSDSGDITVKALDKIIQG